MNWKFPLFTILFTVLGLNVIYKSGQANNRPNILLIMVDDMGFSDLGFMGSLIETPNIDRLARDGLVYTNFYNAGRCCPSRAALMTGQYPHKVGIGWMTGADLKHPGYTGVLSQNCVTIAQTLKENDYACYMTGKWHLTESKNLTAEGQKMNWPKQRGFDKFYGHLGGGSYYKPDLKYNNSSISYPENFYMTRAVTDATVRFLKKHFESKPDKPFFFYVSYLAPHAPLHALPEDIAKYKGKFMQGWNSIRVTKFEQLKQLGIINEKQTLPGWPEYLKKWDELSLEEQKIQDALMAAYAAQLDRADQDIGEIIRQLEQNDELDNTLILFLSDNGASKEPRRKLTVENLKHLGTSKTRHSYGAEWANVSNVPFQGYKKHMHEGGIATPLIAHWPDGIKKQEKIVHQVGHIIDIFPTIMDVTESNYPKNFKDHQIYPLAGKSLVPNFKGRNFDRGAIFFEYEANCAVRDGEWKLVSPRKKESIQRDTWQLYNTLQDRTETNNLAPQYPEKVRELSTLWEKWAGQNNVYPLDGRHDRDRISTR